MIVYEKKTLDDLRDMYDNNNIFLEASATKECYDQSVLLLKNLKSTYLGNKYSSFGEYLEYIKYIEIKYGDPDIIGLCRNGYGYKDRKIKSFELLLSCEDMKSINDKIVGGDIICNLEKLKQMLDNVEVQK